MKKRRKLNKIGKIFIIVIFLILIILLYIFFNSRRNKKEIHILKSNESYSLKIDYPIIHKKIIDSEIKQYVMSKKTEFLKLVEENKKNNSNIQCNFIIQYQMSIENDIYHIHFETYTYTGGNHYIREDKTFHYDSKTKALLDIDDYLNGQEDLKKLSLLSYYYIMKYSEEIGKELDQNMVKKGTESKKQNFQHFNLKADGLEILFPPYQISSLDDQEIKIIIPYNEINLLLKQKYQRQETKKIKEKIIPEKRDFSKLKGKKLIALTFDDGPSYNTTNFLLNGLKKYDARVTFFVLGNRVEQHQDIIRRAYQEGHVIGSHTYNHRNLLLLNDYMILQEIKNTNDVIENTIGIRPELLRPPYGAINSEIKKISNMHIIQWNIDTEDWKNKDKNYIANEIVSKAHDGAIILLHDIYQTSVEGALLAIEQLEKQDYAFVTISEMAQLKNVTLDNTTSYFHFK